MKEYDVFFESTAVRFTEGGEGFPLLLLHGSGPGVSVAGNFARILPELEKRYHVLGMDWIGFGHSGRLTSPPFFNMDVWQRQVNFALQRLQADKVGILAHSLAAVFALRAAASDNRITGVLTTGALGAPFPVTEALETIWTFPATNEALRKALKCLVHDHSLIVDEFVADRFETLQKDDYRSHFSEMFAGDKQRFVDSAVLPVATLKSIRADILMLHGGEDLVIPYADTTLALQRSIPGADAWILARCGHSPALEHPAKLLAAARLLFG